MFSSRNIAKPDQVNIVPFAVLCDFEQIKDAQEAGFSRQFRSDIRKSDGRNRLDFNFSVSHPITASYGDVRRRPNPYGARYTSLYHTFAEAFCKLHRRFQPGVPASKIAAGTSTSPSPPTKAKIRAVGWRAWRYRLRCYKAQYGGHGIHPVFVFSR